MVQAAPPDSVQQLAQQAWAAQENGQTAVAIQQYEAILQQQFQSPALYNNLGLAYAKQGSLGKAIVQWERALRLQPQYADAQHNLQVAQQSITRPIAETAPIALVQVWTTVHQQLTARGWGVLFLGMWALVVGALAYQWKRNAEPERQQSLKKLAIALGVLSVLPLSLGLAQQAAEQDKNTAIVVAAQAGMRPTPALSSEETEVLSEGVRVRIVEEQGEWAKVELPNYLVGWVPKSLMERI